MAKQTHMYPTTTCQGIIVISRSTNYWLDKGAYHDGTHLPPCPLLPSHGSWAAGIRDLVKDSVSLNTFYDYGIAGKERRRSILDVALPDMLDDSVCIDV